MQLDISKLKPEELNAYAAIVSDVRLWAEAFLINPEKETPFKLNNSQKLMLAPGKLKKVLRMHRRCGKSYGLAVLALWYALTHQSAQVLIICPDMGKVQNIMRSIDEFLRVSDFISGEVRASTKMPAIREFKNGSMIKGYTLGSNSKTQGKGVRGSTADLVIIDEAAFLNDDDWPAIEPIMQGDATRPEVITYISSTPTADRNRYWEFCTQAHYDATYDRVHVPVTENPDYDEERIAEIKNEVSNFTFQQEWLANFPDIGEGVYKRSYIDRAQRDYEYYDPKDLKSIPYPAVRTIGVDWDKFNGTGPNIYVLELDKVNNRVFGCYHEEIDPGEYCLTMAVNRIIELNTIFNPQHIFVDRGYGECVAPNTRVTTARGLIPIVDVLIGDRVLTVDGTFDRVLDKVIKTEAKDTYKVYVSNFSSVDVSSTHPFYTIDADGQTSWKNVTELNVGDLVAAPRDTELSIDPLEVRTELHIFLPIRKIEYIGKVSGLVDICVEGGHSFVGNGLVLHNTQIETLHLHGKWHPETGLASKVRGVSFSESIEVLDPITKEHIKKRIKPVMVNITVKWMEDGKFVYPRSHEKFTTQLQDFKVISITDSSIKYSSENEHIIDAFMLAAFALYENYEDPFGIAPAVTSYLLPTPEYVEDDSVTKKQAFGYVSQVGLMTDFKRRTVPALTYNKMDNAGGLDLRRMF